MAGWGACGTELDAERAGLGEAGRHEEGGGTWFAGGDAGAKRHLKRASAQWVGRRKIEIKIKIRNVK
jgi:hypothetical protein